MNRIRARFARLPLQKKMTVVLLLTCGTVLVLACVGLFVFQSVTLRSSFKRNLTALGAVMADNSAAAAAFKDAEAANLLLNTLRGHPDIEGARLILADGKTLGSFDLNHEQDPDEVRGLTRGLREANDHLLLAAPVMVDGKEIGTLLLRADLAALQRDLLNLYAGIGGLVLAAALALALILARWLQPIITRPILQLADTARRIGTEGDYSIRAPDAGTDEVGVLTSAFNGMLEKVQAQDALHHEIAERKRSEAALRASEQRFRSIAESASDAIVVTDEALRILSWNQAASMMFERSGDEVAGQPLAVILGHQGAGLSSADGAGELEARVRGATGETIELAGIRRSGEGFPVEVSIATWKTEEGTCFSAIIRDITERREAEEALRLSQQRLLETSRRAGMAEVATGVLHNVGNILNSVNISATLVADKIGKSVATHLANVAAAFREHAEDLPQFLATDERGRRLPGFVVKLAEASAEERQGLLSEVELLRKNVTHIKDVVAMQQNYARVSGVIETLQMAALMEDAIEINDAALGRHCVQVVRDFSPAPNLHVDKHKVLQILVNLIRNAKYAMDEAGHERKVLELIIRPTERETVLVTVKDNGIGIPPDSLTKIFSHGFTTKTDGHGFGLHTSANAAREMGGSLTAASDGPGTGAAFTLELPVRLPTPRVPSGFARRGSEDGSAPPPSEQAN